MKALVDSKSKKSTLSIKNSILVTISGNFFKVSYMIKLLNLIFVSLLGSSFELQDQFEQKWVANQTPIQILFASDMEGYKLLNQYFEKNAEATKRLNVAQIVYVADISKMPSLISKMFAIPKMKKLNYSIYLDKSGEVTKNWFRTEKGISVLKKEGDQTLKLQVQLKNLSEVEKFFNEYDKNN
jgi:hypothetical protein